MEDCGVEACGDDDGGNDRCNCLLVVKETECKRWLYLEVEHEQTEQTKA